MTLFEKNVVVVFEWFIMNEKLKESWEDECLRIQEAIVICQLDTL